MNTQSIEPTERTFVRAASLADLPAGSRATVNLDGHVIALFHTPEGISLSTIDARIWAFRSIAAP